MQEQLRISKVQLDKVRVEPEINLKSSLIILCCSFVIHVLKRNGNVQFVKEQVEMQILNNFLKIVYNTIVFKLTSSESETIWKILQRIRKSYGGLQKSRRRYKPFKSRCRKGRLGETFKKIKFKSLIFSSHSLYHVNDSHTFWEPGNNVVKIHIKNL